MNLYISRIPKSTDWINYDLYTARKYIKNMLFEKKELRQGWGFSTYDLRVDKESWVQQAMNNPMGADTQSTGIRKYAEKRFSILSPMCSIEVGDIIIIPNVSKELLDDTSVFTIVTAASTYDFEDRSSFDEGYEKDFGHLIKIENIKCFSRNDFYINFGAYQKSFNRVHQQKIKDYINKYYLEK